MKLVEGQYLVLEVDDSGIQAVVTNGYEQQPWSNVRAPI
jgi:hypothetical protein